jgi:hypothetical protein
VRKEVKGGRGAGGGGRWPCRDPERVGRYLDAKGRALRGLTEAGEDVALELTTKGLCEAHGGGALALPKRGWCDASHHDVFAIRLMLQALQDVETDLGLVGAVELELKGRRPPQGEKRRRTSRVPSWQAGQPRDPGCQSPWPGGQWAWAAVLAQFQCRLARACTGSSPKERRENPHKNNNQPAMGSFREEAGTDAGEAAEARTFGA